MMGIETGAVKEVENGLVMEKIMVSDRTLLTGFSGHHFLVVPKHSNMP